MRRGIKKVDSNPQNYKKCMMCGATNLLESEQCVNCGSRFALKGEPNVGMALQITKKDIKQPKEQTKWPKERIDGKERF